ncbi:hypothetical protein ETD86_34740 [Nonomuraea turkmeniaca]|uniref:Uncharacterized protein n=1 Tax=Nonomuraea turkmeniaca TaxID=103838 RepID=A0A5S4F6Y2_9ACTN|nr:hypothetical protein [Nonomuraea turkmeniaca]TMR11729.1 hypothetical protein ETD86_34740 [Nonomuraea turkmeniaca]
MAEISIPRGPIQEPPYEAIPYTLGQSPAPANREALRAALSPLELGVYDRQVLDWLSGEAPQIVATVCSLLARKEAEARADERRKTIKEIAVHFDDMVVTREWRRRFEARHAEHLGNGVTVHGLLSAVVDEIKGMACDSR